MGISTLSFNNAKIFKNKMYFTLDCSNGVSTKVFDSCGRNLYNKLSHQPVKTEKENFVIIERKNEYEIPDRKKMVSEIIKRIYDKSGKFLRTVRTVQETK